MRKPLFLLLAGSVSAVDIHAQMDYTQLYEKYKNFEEEKTVTLYLTGSHLYGKYNNVNMLLLAANLPQINANAQAVGCGGMIMQDRLLVGSDLVIFHTIFQTGDYVQSGGFGYFYAGYKFYDGEKAEVSVLTGFGLGYMNVYLRPSELPGGIEKPSAPATYALYNIRPLGAGLFLYNYSVSYSYRCSKRFSMGLIVGVDCMPGSAWNLKNSQEFSSITKLQEGTAKGYVSITTGYCFER